MTLTRKDAASAEVHKRRDEIMAELAAKKRRFTIGALFEDEQISKHLKAYAEGCEESLIRRAKKCDMKPVDENLHYGVALGSNQAVEFWVHKVFS
ncbi:hypothetical protein HJB53_30050 [Rhizobium lentis]|uniref:hypothetical protein n=2 Tax=Rhizobium TaxID=379 RepID=UPI001C834272|nr:hypothetical protein [Rhizobium lentis]MBX5130734.1 hypothetical protein [Rhizobium lentis]